MSNSEFKIKHSKLIIDGELIETTTKFEFNLGFAKANSKAELDTIPHNF